MLQAYSSNIEIAANTPCPFSNVTLDKGCAETLTGTSTIELNRCGVYMVEFDGYCAPASAGLVTFQLYKNGVAMSQAINGFTGTVDNLDSVSFKTLVQVQTNNSNCCCSSPVVLQILTGDVGVEQAHINCCVTKLC